jgi:hypothetical protein
VWDFIRRMLCVPYGGHGPPKIVFYKNYVSIQSLERVVTLNKLIDVNLFATKHNSDGGVSRDWGPRPRAGTSATGISPGQDHAS